MALTSVSGARNLRLAQAVERKIFLSRVRSGVHHALDQVERRLRGVRVRMGPMRTWRFSSNHVLISWRVGSDVVKALKKAVRASHGVRARLEEGVAVEARREQRVMATEMLCELVAVRALSHLRQKGTSAMLAKARSRTPCLLVGMGEKRVLEPGVLRQVKPAAAARL